MTAESLINQAGHWGKQTKNMIKLYIEGKIDTPFQDALRRGKQSLEISVKASNPLRFPRRQNDGIKL